MKILKLRSIILFLMILSSTNLFSQEGYEDVVYLKNGSIIHGIIIEQVPNVSIKVQTYDKNVFFYKIEEVEKITKELKPSDVKQKLPRKTNPKRGITIQANLIAVGASAVVSYLIYPVSIGIGTGLNVFYGILYDGKGYVPIFIDSKVYFTNTKVSPFLACEFGTTLKSGENEKGLHINPHIGIKLRHSDHLAFNFSAGVAWELAGDWDDYLEHYDYYYKAIPDVKLGVSYKF